MSTTTPRSRTSALVLGLTWLYWVLIADSMLSPSGSAIIFTASNARNVFGLAKNGFFPRGLIKINDRFRVPTRALLFNFVVGVLFLLPLPSWHQIIGVTGTLAVFTFSIGSVSLFAFRNVGLGDRSSHLPGMRIVCPFAFVVASLVIFWVGWTTLAKTIPIVVIGLIWYAVCYVRNKDGAAEVVGGVWLVSYLMIMYVLSFVGSFDGRGLIPGPWDSVVVAGVALLIYVWGVRSATTYMRTNTEQTEGLKRDYEDALQRR